MKITELLHESVISETTRPTIDQAKEILAKAGYELIGSGFESLVYKKADSPYVLKLLDAQAVAYMDFISLVKANPNPHFPKFKGNLINVLPGYYYAIRMEHLTPYTLGREVIRTIERYTTQLARTGGIVQNVDPSVLDAFNELEKTQPDIGEAAWLIATKLLINPNYHSDMFDQNFMMRGTTLVFTDPVIFDDTEY